MLCVHQRRSCSSRLWSRPAGTQLANTIARPFSWNFTHNDLEDLLHRSDAHNNRQPHAPAA
jgi:hypothetical protein